MRLVFAGTPRFAAVALESLLAAGHDISLVLTQPDRPAGRGMKVVESEVKACAVRHSLSVAQPATLKGEEPLALLRAANAEVMVVAAYGLLLPRSVLDLFPDRCINIHASLLPRWRGAAPIQRAILAGDEESGISIMRMEAGLDTGPVYLTGRLAVGARETAGSLHDRLAPLGGELICRFLEQLHAGTARAEPQDSSLATYAAKVTREEAELHWSRDAHHLDRVVRAFDPAPGAFFRLGDETVKVWSARPVALQSAALPGTVTGTGDGAIRVQCAQQTALELLVLQRAGGKRLAADQFLRGFPLEPGRRLDHGPG